MTKKGELLHMQISTDSEDKRNSYDNQKRYFEKNYKS